MNVCNVYGILCLVWHHYLVVYHEHTAILQVKTCVDEKMRDTHIKLHKAASLCFCNTCMTVSMYFPKKTNERHSGLPVCPWHMSVCLFVCRHPSVCRQVLQTLAESVLRAVCEPLQLVRPPQVVRESTHSVPVGLVETVRLGVGVGQRVETLYFLYMYSHWFTSII